MLNKIRSVFFQVSQRNKSFNIPLPQIGFILSSGLMMALSMLLVYEYFFFKRQSEKMLEMKEDYRNYVVAVKKILHDYHKNKEKLEELETMLEEKKKDFEDGELNVLQSGFPDGVRVYSSDDEEDEVDSSFLTINRELEYLKQGTLEYLKKQHMNTIAQALGENIWLDYTDQIEAERNRAEEKKRNRKIRRHAMRSQGQTRRYDYMAKKSQLGHKRKAQDMSLMWPIDRSSFWLSSFYGPRKKPNGLWGFHYGIDMAAVKGTPVKAAASGVVVEARYAAGYGKTVVIAHNQKYRTRYAHLNVIVAKVGQKVERGDCVGKVGATGFVRSKRGGDASHLHFEVYVFGKQANPLYFLA